MNDNFDVLAAELSKFTKTMLVDFILKKSLPATCKISGDLHSVLLGTSDNVTPSDDDDSVNVAHILKSVVTELKVISSSNLKMHDMINRLSAGTPRVSSSQNGHPAPSLDTKHISVAEPVRHSSTRKMPTAVPKYIVGSKEAVSSDLTAVPVVKFGDIFVSRFDPLVTASQLKNELFVGVDVSISQMVTRHPSYSSFHVRIPAEMLADVLQPTFWPEGIMVKRFWGRLLPERIVNSSTSKN
ncbi:unnamed protein product [Macrosiphum euphorbiae]|uniref:Uncharacterized protein n=1 Tax=Macrosiphum euphorbiae TaxID=13131 RepID=A0AAV0XUI6_9HEMI|nr:unnamed protein product [Macrosiphum euphorbiae]